MTLTRHQFLRSTAAVATVAVSLPAANSLPFEAAHVFDPQGYFDGGDLRLQQCQREFAAEVESLYAYLNQAVVRSPA